MPSGVRFQQFLEGWMVRQEHYLDELLSVEQHCHESSHEDLEELIARILAHYEQYYEEKSRMAHGNIFLVFSPPWFTPFERSFLWIAGFKPGLAFRVLDRSVDDLSVDQRPRMSRLMEETRVSERILGDELARIQESVATQQWLNSARRQGRTGEDERLIDHSATERLAAEMEAVVGRADLLRTNTVVKVAEILNPIQSVKFLRAVTELQLRVRNLGLPRR